MNRIITYAVEKETGIVWSRVGDQVALPVLQWDSMTPANGFEPDYQLEAFDIMSIRDQWRGLRWTKKIPTELKNRHRAFWGMRQLPTERTGQ